MAIAMLASSYWFQIWRIHIHRDVRDLSLTYHILFEIGFGLLIITTIIEESFIFFFKQITTFIPIIE